MVKRMSGYTKEEKEQIIKFLQANLSKNPLVKEIIKKE